MRKTCDQIYPPILWRSEVYEKEKKSCVRVEVEFDGETPHFGGAAWIRKGSESIITNDEIFQRLIDLRSGTIRELAKWINKKVTIHGDPSTIPDKSVTAYQSYAGPQHRWGIAESAKIVAVNSFWITLERQENKERVSEPLRKLTLSYDDKSNRLKLIIAY